MEIIQNISIFIAMLFTIMLLDYLWLGIITKNFIITQFGSLVKVTNGSIDIKLIYGILAWSIIALGALIFAVHPNDTIAKAALMGAVFGFITYGIYDLTNITFIQNYPIKFGIVDIAWGTFLCGTISAVGKFISKLF
jgi:uncharacterized membrane protein